MRAPQGLNRYDVGLPLVMANPQITRTQLAKELTYLESTASYIIQAYHAAAATLLKAGWLPPNATAVVYPHRPNRYDRGFALLMDHPKMTQAQLAKQLTLAEPTANFILQAWRAAYDTFMKAGWHPAG